MYLVSITRLRLRSPSYLPGFLYFTILSFWQSWRSRGNMCTKVKRDGNTRLCFWTVTVWESEAGMRAFRNAGAHRKAMQRLAFWCDEATYLNWIQPAKEPPTWDEVYDRLIADGAVSPVRFPSPNHASRNFPKLKNSGI